MTREKVARSSNATITFASIAAWMDVPVSRTLLQCASISWSLAPGKESLVACGTPSNMIQRTRVRANFDDGKKYVVGRREELAELWRN